MIICSFNKRDIGYKTELTFLAAIGKEVDPPQPVVITRFATREEFFKYWESQDRKAFQTIIQEHGEPDAPYYYEVTTD